MEKQRKLASIILVAIVVGVSVMSIATAVLYKINQDNSGEFAATSAPPEVSCISASKACVGAGCWCAAPYNRATCVHNASCNTDAWCSSINCSVSVTNPPSPTPTGGTVTGTPKPTTVLKREDGVCIGLINDPTQCISGHTVADPGQSYYENGVYVGQVYNYCVADVPGGFQNVIGGYICGDSPFDSPSHSDASEKCLATDALTNDTRQCCSGKSKKISMTNGYEYRCLSPDQDIRLIRTTNTTSTPVPNNPTTIAPTVAVTTPPTSTQQPPSDTTCGAGYYYVDCEHEDKYYGCNVGQAVCYSTSSEANESTLCKDNAYCASLVSPTSTIATTPEPNNTQDQASTSAITEFINVIFTSGGAVFNGSFGTILLLAFVIISSVFGITILVSQALNKKQK